MHIETHNPQIMSSRRDLLLAAFSAGIMRANGPASARCVTDDWTELEPFFRSPAEFANDLGRFRSPLIFKDGRRVKSAADWNKRRGEIRKEWMHLMGPWPQI